MEPLEQKTENLDEVRRRKRKEENKSKKRSTKLIILITLGLIATTILSFILLIKASPNFARIVEDKIFCLTGISVDVDFDGMTSTDWTTTDKPVIYLYPEEDTDVTVKLDITGDLTYTYPEYKDSWNVIAKPDGTLINKEDNQEYSYLFWEANSNNKYDLSKGFVVKGEDTAKFLQKTLAKLGLTPREYNEFIVYWLPQMRDNKYNLITFQNKDYTDTAKLDIQPEPDSILRVFMAYKPLDNYISIEEPELKTFERKGFTVVEWGGTELN